MNIIVVFSKIRKIEVFDVTNKFLQSLSTFLNRGFTGFENKSACTRKTILIFCC